MNFYILDPYKEDNWRLVKDTAGGYGTGNDFGNNFLSKKMNKLVSKMISMPPMYAIYVYSIIKSKNRIFKSETNLLRLSNLKSKRYLNWQPKWKLNESIDKIIEWNREKQNKKPIDICERQIKEFLKE